MINYDPAAFVTNATSPYYQAPFSLNKLGPVYERGLYAPAVAGLASVTSCLLLLFILGRKVVTWSRGWSNYITYNQYLILLANLLLADAFTGMSMVISFYWISIDAIYAPTATCNAQAWLLNIGDVGSSFFILLIALHTFYTTVRGQRLSVPVFLTCVGAAWMLAVSLSVLGPIMHGANIFVPTAGWCWINRIYQNERLAFRFFWMFFTQFFCLITYFLVLLFIRRSIKEVRAISGDVGSSTQVQIDRVARYMVIYPIIYIVLTLPLAAGRMWDTAHPDKRLPQSYLVASITLVASGGWIDALLYTYTRRHLIVAGSQVESKHYSSQANGYASRRPSLGPRQISAAFSRRPSLPSRQPSSYNDHFALVTIGGGPIRNSKGAVIAIAVGVEETEEVLRPGSAITEELEWDRKMEADAARWIALNEHADYSTMEQAKQAAAAAAAELGSLHEDGPGGRV